MDTDIGHNNSLNGSRRGHDNRTPKYVKIKKELSHMYSDVRRDSKEFLKSI